MDKRKRIIIGISGASGAIYGVRLLQQLADTNLETHLIISKAAACTITTETEFSLKAVQNMADYAYSVSDISAAIASGSYKTVGMIIAPCSMRSLGEIASGATSSLLTRAADVTLKERRRLVLLVRETPLTTIHLHNMCTISQAGGIIAPPVPAFYHRPQTVDDIVNQTIGRVLDLFNIETDIVYRWRENSKISS